MRTWLLSFALLCSFNAAGGAVETLSASDICRRFEVESEVYLYDQSGEILLNAMGERRVSTFRDIHDAATKGCEFQHSWSSRSSLFKGSLYIEQKWVVDPQGHIDATLSQWEIFSNKPKDRRELKSETIRVKDMTPIVWRSLIHKDPVVVVRWTPRLRQEEIYKDLSKLPMVGEDMVIYDNYGKIWAYNLNFSGIYTGVTTINGTLLLSFYKFEGAKELGTARDNQAFLRLSDKISVTMRSQGKLLPAGVESAVYGTYEPKNKSADLDSQTIFNRSDETEFLKRHRE